MSWYSLQGNNKKFNDLWLCQDKKYISRIVEQNFYKLTICNRKSEEYDAAQIFLCGLHNL